MGKKSSESFIDNETISFFEKLKSNPPTKLVEYLKSLNTLYTHKHYIVCAIGYKSCFRLYTTIFWPQKHRSIAFPN